MASNKVLDANIIAIEDILPMLTDDKIKMETKCRIMLYLIAIRKVGVDIIEQYVPNIIDIKNAIDPIFSQFTVQNVYFHCHYGILESDVLQYLIDTYTPTSLTDAEFNYWISFLGQSGIEYDHLLTIISDSDKIINSDMLSQIIADYDLCDAQSIVALSDICLRGVEPKEIIDYFTKIFPLGWDDETLQDYQEIFVPFESGGMDLANAINYLDFETLCWSNVSMEFFASIVGIDKFIKRVFKVVGSANQIDGYRVNMLMKFMVKNAIWLDGLELKYD
jgi:hypothetical protein